MFRLGSVSATSVRRAGLILASLTLLSGTARAQEPGDVRIIVGPNLRASANTSGGDRSESWIAANPRNPDFLLGVSMIWSEPNPFRCATTISRNGGETWREIRLPGQEGDCFDRMVLATAEGRMYVLHTVILQGDPNDSRAEARRRGTPEAKGTIRVWATEDDGRTWMGPTELYCPLVPDHPRMAVDESGGPHHGRLYVAWNEVRDTLLKGEYHIFLHHSDDGGETFSEPIPLGSAEGGKLVATEPLVLSDGTLLVTYFQYYRPMRGAANDRKPFYIKRSTDGGATFGPPERIMEFGISGWRHLWPFASAFPLPIVAVDASPSSRYRDRIYMVWDDASAGESNIWLMWSDDEGRNWSRASRLNDNVPEEANSPPDLRMIPVVAISERGVVGVAWYERRDDPARRCWKQYFTASLDGGETFLPNVPVSTATSCPAPNLAPRVYVSNLAEGIDETRPTREEVALMREDSARSRWAEELAFEEARRDADRGVAPRIRIAFDAGRIGQPGHYSALTADATGAFHALWADRRSGIQQLFTARIEVTTDPLLPVAETKEADLTASVALFGGPATFNEAEGTATFELQARNLSNRTIYGPLLVRVSRVARVAGSPTVEFIDPDGGGNGVGAFWDFSDLMGTAGRLEPGMITEARVIKVRVGKETGLDGVFEFKVLGRLSARPASR